ncbi:MAG TPA: bifunctional diguanylate cyclase/phosphodiesterase, partial [Noviherbaspirillum sp.]
DRFKVINDTHGHEAGDAVLQEAAHRMAKSIRYGDYAFRLGGDEFLVLLPECDDGNDAAEVARHLCEALNRPYHVGTLVLSSSPSIGISIYPRDGKDIDTLINHADAAMYQAKQLGRNNFQFFSHELAERAKAHLDIEQQLRSAIAKGEFHLHYQPVINMQTLELVCAEALLRWPDAKRGPDVFVPIAESTGMIARLGDWVLREACRQHKHWIEKGLPAIPISVNVSAVQFRDKTFAERFERILQECEVDAMALQLEITETTVMENLEYTIGVLMALRKRGIKILLDDFGTGYSSLSYLSRLPVDKIKVDKSFTHQLAHDMTSRAVTEAIIALGRTMNKEIIAEGIESREVLDYLRVHGCHHAQGYHVSRPVDGQTFESWYWAHQVPMGPPGGLPPQPLH